MKRLRSEESDSEPELGLEEPEESDLFLKAVENLMDKYRSNRHGTDLPKLKQQRRQIPDDEPEGLQ